jgi:hypothetical protein
MDVWTPPKKVLSDTNPFNMFQHPYFILCSIDFLLLWVCSLHEVVRGFFSQESPLQQIISPKQNQTSRPSIFDILLVAVRFYRFCLTDRQTLWRLGLVCYKRQHMQAFHHIGFFFCNRNRKLRIFFIILLSLNYWEFVFIPSISISMLSLNHKN